jgi:hypothetical protein
MLAVSHPSAQTRSTGATRRGHVPLVEGMAPRLSNARASAPLSLFRAGDTRAPPRNAAGRVRCPRLPIQAADTPGPDAHSALHARDPGKATGKITGSPI